MMQTHVSQNTNKNITTAFGKQNNNKKEKEHLKAMRKRPPCSTTLFHKIAAVSSKNKKTCTLYNLL